jgi:hypothetical protein
MAYPSIGRDVLGCLVTGYAKGGTTLVKDLLVQTTDMVSGFEGGLLLASSPAEGIPEPHARHLLEAWRPGRDFLDRYRECRTFAEGYRLLRDSARQLPDKDAPLIDKTPEYLVCLADVLRRAPGTPLVIVVRDPLAVIVSWLQLGNSLTDAIAWVRAASESLLWAIARAGVFPLYVVNLADVIGQPDATLAPLQAWLGRPPRSIDPRGACGLPYEAGGRDGFPRGIETDRHDITSRCSFEKLAAIRREVDRAMPYRRSIAALRSGPCHIASAQWARVA